MNAKKILASAVAVAALYCGAAYLSGYLGEKDVRAQIELAKSQPQSSQFDIQLLAYRRGVFTSDIQLAVVSPDAIPGGKMEIIVDNAVQHGPLLLAGRPTVGAYATTSTFHFKTGLPEMDKKIAEVFSAGLGTAVSTVQYNGNYDLTWVLPPLKASDHALQFTLGESRLTATGNTKDASGAGTMTLGRFEMTTAQGAQLSMSPVVAEFTAKNIEPGINLINMDASVDLLDIRPAAKPPVQIKGLTFVQNQTLAGANIDGSSKVGVAKFTGPVEIDNLYFHMDLDGVSREAMRRLAAFKNPPPGGTEEEQQVFAMAQFKELLPVLLQKGLSLKLATGGTYGGGNTQAEWLIQYKGPADGRDIMTIADPLEYLQLADSTLLVKAPATLVPQQLVANHIDTYVAHEGNDYVLRATLQDGALTIGKTPIPKEMLVAMLAGMSKEQPPRQPAAAQRPRRS